MLKTKLVSAVAILTLSATAFAPSASAETPREGAVCERHPALTVVDGAHDRARKGWNADKLKKNKVAIKHVRIQRMCVPEGKPKKHVKAAIYSAKHQYKKAKSEAALAASNTPYDCGAHGSFAIPCYIVACESEFNWGAYNESGAAGPYQIMPEWGRPWPIRSDADRAEHHRIAAMIWNGGSGASNWLCA